MFYSNKIKVRPSFTELQNNIPAAPSYGEYISHMIRYSRACGSYQDYLYKGLWQTRNLLNKVTTS